MAHIKIIKSHIIRKTQIYQKVYRSRDFITGKTYSGWAITGYFLDADLITFQNSFIKPISTTVSLNMKTIRWHK